MSTSLQSFIFMMIITTSTSIFSSDSKNQNQSFLSKLDQRQVQLQRSTISTLIKKTNDNTRAHANIHLMHPINQKQQYLYFTDQPVAYEPAKAFYTTEKYISVASPCTTTKTEPTDEEKKRREAVREHCIMHKYRILDQNPSYVIQRSYSENFNPTVTSQKNDPYHHNWHYRPTK